MANVSRTSAPPRRRLRREHSRRASIAVGSCMLLIVAACQLFLGKGGKSELVFPHGPHVEELDCSDCHEGAEEGTAAGFPATDNGCRLCHKDLDEGKPFEKTVDAFMVDGKPRWLARGTASNGDVKFDHSKHYEAELECDVCHAADIDLDASTKGLRIAGGKKTCLECHEKTDRGNDCAVCHEVLRHDVAPPSHAMDWKRLHGSESRHMIDGLGQTTCAQCHEDQVESCSKCHQREMPESHNNFWRIRGHSLLASNDRQLCATCHQPDYCLACHRSTRPRSHRGAFGPPGNRHCVGCHVEPAAKAGCTVCHQEPMHPLGNSIPGNTAHQRAKSPFDCMSCHVALKHANPGIDCRACHK